MPSPTNKLWRSLEELAQDQAFRDLVEREFRQAPGSWDDPISRRRFLTLMGAVLGLTGMAGCSTSLPPQPIVPYVRAPEAITPGRPLYFATAMPQAGYGLGVLVETHEGRPTKIEGNPLHPSCPRPADSAPQSLYGPTNAFAQASVLELYDPDRSQSVTYLGDISSWAAFVTALRSAQAALRDGAGLYILTQTVTSPTLTHQLQRLTRQLPGARWHVYEPLGRDNVLAGTRQAFGVELEPHYRLEQADVILSLDGDFLGCGPSHVLHQQAFASRRRVRLGENRDMNRLYVVEASCSTTGAGADHRLPVRPSQVELVARAIAGRVDPSLRNLTTDAALPVPFRWLDAVADDLVGHRQRSLVLAGDAQPAFVHALAHALNVALDNVGRTVRYTASANVRPSAGGSLRELVEEIQAGRVRILLMLGGNPVYDAPADLDFALRLARVGLRVHLGLYEDETSAHCHWHIPQAHYLEAWGDIRSHDGTVSIQQPLISPLYAGKNEQELLAIVLGEGERASYEIVRSCWSSLFEPGKPRHREDRAAWAVQAKALSLDGGGLGGGGSTRFPSVSPPPKPSPARGEGLQALSGDFSSWWQRVLHDGFAADTSLPSVNVSLRPGWHGNARPATPAGELEIAFQPDPAVHDGRYANNAWLQELPRPITSLTWDNAVFLSPATAVALDLASSDRPEQASGKVVELRCRGRTVSGPLWVLPGHPDGTLTVPLGYGRTRAGHVGNGVGFDGYRLRTSANPWFVGGATVRPTGQVQALACTQHHHLMENRDIVRTGTPSQPPAQQRGRVSLTLYDAADHPRSADQWAMVIDLGLCTGCSACVVACQAENNIAVVGKEQVQRGREMHWLRVDSYYRGTPSNPETYFHPVPCMHCENAPCELVCPVGATVHSSDGLNDMVYNRCVGTRYCSNNCPYKVRRFNFLEYGDWGNSSVLAPAADGVLHGESLRLQRNPEVTVRSRGVMEKCTYCVQRIRAGQSVATREDRNLRDGEVVTACQAACPAGAITFGNLNGPDHAGHGRSKVAQLQDEPYRYSLLAELNTRPRTTYLAAFRNPNPRV